MKQILVPTDFSPYSDSAVDAAIYIAREKGMAIHLVHVASMPYNPEYEIGMLNMTAAQPAIEVQIKDQLKRQLVQVAEKVKNSGVEVSFSMVTESTAADGIIKEINESDAELVIIGGKGAGGIEGILMGSVADKIIKYSKLPVLTVKNLFSNYQIKRIVFANNFQDKVAEPVIGRIIKFAEIFHAELKFLKIIPERPLGSAADKSVKNIDTSPIFGGRQVEIIYSDSIEKGILDYARSNQIDLISMCTHARTGLSALWKGSIAEKVADHSFIPVLTYNINPEIAEIKNILTS